MNEPAATASFYYYPGSASIQPDGTIEVQASWYESCSHSSGAALIKPGNANYAFWRWLVENAQLFPQLTNENMATAREAFEKTRVATAAEMERKVDPDHGLPDA